jgi:hypothetical protein
MLKTIKLIRFRPSSHSDDGTIVATFKTEAKAKEAAECIDTFQLRRDKNKVVLVFCNEPPGSIDWYTKSLNSHGAVQTKYYMRYEELVIRVFLPLGVTRAMVPLIVNVETFKILQELRQRCPKQNIKEIKTEGGLVLRFKYEGEGILDRCGTELSFDYGKEFPIPDNVKVIVMKAF